MPMKTKYIEKRGSEYVVLNKSGKVLSKHKSRSAAESSFRAMMASKHGHGRPKGRGKK